MAEKGKKISESNDKTYVKKPEIYYSYKFQPYIRDLGRSPGKNMTQEDRNKRQQHENNVNAVRNVVKGLSKTFGTAISGASTFYGGGWALNRLLHLNKPSTLGQFFGKYALPANTADNISDGVELIFNPSIEGAVDLGSGVVLGKFKDLSKPARQVGELVGQGANINNMKNGGKMNILEFLKNGSGIHIKKKNRGSFTRWCGGNVTEECIRRGKASSNPKIRKKATFADNARHFKHQQGGTIVNGLMDIYRSIKQNQAIDASMDAMRQQVELDKQKLFYNEYKKQLGLQTDRSDIVNANKAYNEAKNIDYSDVNQQFLDKQQQLLNQKQQNNNNLISSIGGISGTILNSIGKKKNTSSSNNNKIFTTDSFWTNPTLKNSQVNNNFWTNPTIANATKNFNL